MRASNIGGRMLAGEHGMAIRSILVATDLSAQENIALQRAWWLADTHRAAVRLMYLPQRGEPAAAHAASRLANAARQLEESLELRVESVPVGAHRLQDLLEQAAGMDLVVLPHRRERSTAAFFRGQPVVRLLRGCRCPVLVTRITRAGPYRRTLVAVDFSRESEALVAFAAEFDGRAELEIFHAICTLNEARLRSAEATEQAVRAYRERCLRQAQERMLTLTDSFDARRNRVHTLIDRGDPGRQAVVQQERSNADLVVLGKRRSTAWEDFFCGSVAHRVLSWGRSDVLVVPQDWLSASAPAAARRMKTDTSEAAFGLQPARRAS